MKLRNRLSIRSRKVELDLNTENRRFRQFIDASLFAGSEIGRRLGGAMRVSRPSGSHSYELLAAPIFDSTVKFEFNRAMVALFIRDPSARMVTPVDGIGATFGLTASEARLLNALLAGESFQDY